MKSSTTAVGLLALTALSSARAINKRQNACIVDTVLNPSTTQVQDSINQWLDDVNTVNSFLNSASGLIAANDPDALVTAAQTALTNAQDEPCQLMTLASQPDFSDGPAAFTCAVGDLMDVFGPHVLDNLNAIIMDPGDAVSVQNAVDDINLFRCCNVLGDASIMWQDSAEINGIGNQVTTVAPLEDACANITCANRCGLMDNSSFGTPGDVQIGS